MTDDKLLRDARVKAEKAVADMAEGPIKVKAFEVAYSHLLASGIGTVRDASSRSNKKARIQTAARTNTLSERILMLQGDGFFNTPQVIGAIREGLQVHGWHYPVTTLSGTLQALVQRRKLRRERVKENNKVAWKYSNP